MCLKLARIKTLVKPLTVYKVIIPSSLGGYCTLYTQTELPSQLEGYKLKAEGALLLQNGNYIGKGIIHAYSTLTQAKIVWYAASSHIPLHMKYGDAL